MWCEGPQAYRDLLMSQWTVLMAKCGWPKLLPRQTHGMNEVRTGNLNLMLFCFIFWLQKHLLIWIDFHMNPCAKQRVFKALSPLYSSLVIGNKIFSNRFFWQKTLLSFPNQMQSKLLSASSYHIPVSCEHTPKSPWSIWAPSAGVQHS